MTESAEMRALFFDEADEQLRRLGDGLLDFERRGADRDLLDGIFRAAHTLKGAAGMMGYAGVARLVHRMEDLLDRIRAGELAAAPPLPDALLAASDRARALIDDLRADRAEGSPDAALAALDAAAAAATAVPAGTGDGAGQTEEAAPFTPTEYDRTVAAELASLGHAIRLVRYRVDPAAPMPSVNAFFVLTALKGKGEIIRSAPTEEEMEGDCGPAVAALLATRADNAELLAALDATGMAVSREIVPFDAETVPGDGAGPSPTETTARDAPQDGEAGPPHPAVPADPAPGPAAASAPAGENAATATRGAILRIDSRRVDECVNLVGELSITLARYQAIDDSIRRHADCREVHRTLRDATQRFERLAGELQDRTMSLRMVPVSHLFDRFPRVARDLSRALGKTIELSIAGGDTELDKTVVDDLYEPLLHLVRNAADHGLEPADARRSAGKSPAGTIRLAARHEGQHALITVEDDGRGLDLERIRAKAVERGLIDRRDAGALGEREVFAFIFEAGFSTSATVSDLSGRGVGMDVVRRSIERMKGAIAIDSAAGRGTVVTVKIPLSLAVLPALLVEAGGAVYALPLSAVHELIRVKPEELRTIEGREVVRHRDQVTPVLRLGARLANAAPVDPAAPLPLALVRSLGRPFALAVDGFLGERRIVQKSLDRAYCSNPDVSGASVLGDGRVILILDPLSLCERAAGALRAEGR